MKIVRIDWFDAATSHNWSAVDDNGLEKITSIGYFVRQTKDEIVITTSFDAGGRCICPLAIPRKCVTRKVFLKSL